MKWSRRRCVLRNGAVVILLISSYRTCSVSTLVAADVFDALTLEER